MNFHDREPIPGTDEVRKLLSRLDGEFGPLSESDLAWAAKAMQLDPVEMKVNECFPNSWRASVSFATHDHDGTYGASLGSQQLEECQVCGAWVGDKLKHVAWHMRFEGRT